MNYSSILPQYLENVSSCLICSQEGYVLYQCLTDKLVEIELPQWQLWQCHSCGHIWLNPRLCLEYIHLAYQEYANLHWGHQTGFSSANWKLYLKQAYFSVAYGYRSKVPWFIYPLGYLGFLSPRFRQKLDRQVLFLPPVENGRLLDVGCGRGWFLENMQQLGWQVEGVDTDPESVKIASQRGVLAKLGGIEDQNYPSDYFDAITIYHVIEHLHFPDKTLQECFRILKPAGKLVIVTPNIESLGHSIFHHAWLSLDVPRHLHLFNIRSLKTAVLHAGFSIDKLYTHPYDAAHIWLKSHAIYTNGNYLFTQKENHINLLKAKFFSWYEHIILLWQEKAGEELITICHK